MNPEMGKIKDVRDVNGNEKQICGLRNQCGKKAKKVNGDASIKDDV